MQKINFTNGHHLDINTMEYIQDAYSEPIEALAKATHLQNYIISGVETSWNGVIATVSDGWVVLDGEPMEFRGGTYNGNDENPECYVVKRTETAYNLNANGQSVAAFTKTYATLAADENGAIYVGTLAEYRLKAIVTAPIESGQITVSDNSMLCQNDNNAMSFGAGSVELATPRYRYNGYTVAISGVFYTHDWSEHPANVTFGTIPGWTHGSLTGIPCDLHVNLSNGSPATVKGHARITDTGGILLEFRYNGMQSPNAITFDGTPIILL